MQLGCIPRDNKIGVLLAQLGTPDAPTPKALRKYLKQFLADRRVVDKNPVLWWLILNCFILVTRPARSAALYKNIWTEKGSPLLFHTKSQCEALRAALEERNIQVEFGMRYGSSPLSDAISRMINNGCRRILLLPLYPQYSAPTTASTYDAVFPELLKARWVPSLKVVDPYFAHPEYIAALAHTINESLARLPQLPQRLVLSYHGIPLEYIKNGDPYCCQCTETTQHLLPLLNFPPEHVIHTFQSRFGRDPWLEPYTDVTIDALPAKGITHIAVACPGFVSDCLETIDEMGREATHAFLEAGGKTLDIIPCLNDHPRWIQALETICLSELKEWLDLDAKHAHANKKIQCPLTNC
jgi:protoporphyrin/coproporphyrin ferrochelatase